MAEARVRQIGIFVFDEVEELDAIGPWEVLSCWTTQFPQDGWQAFVFAAEAKPVTCAKGLVITPHHSMSAMPALDVLVHPGGHGTRPLLANEEYLTWIRGQREIVPLLTSVCTGSLVYAGAGLLAGRPATTHWGAFELLKELDPTIDVQPDARFVDDGDIITAAGVSAGIDMALHLVSRLASVERAREVRRSIQYDPEPPV